MSSKIRRDIESVLHWAYRDELPKRNVADDISPMFRVAELGTGIDGGDGGEPGFAVIFGPPHPDAFIIERAVNDLAPIEVQWPEARELLAPEFGPLMLLDRDITITRLLVEVRVYVTTHARMGNRPQRYGETELQRQIAPNGKVKVVGTGANKRYREGSFCPLTVAPDPRELVADRAVYIAWHHALTTLAERLGESLASVFPIAPAASPAPWITPDPQPRILTDLSKPATLRRSTPMRHRQLA